jgi:photoactive yellow protein
LEKTVQQFIKYFHVHGEDPLNRMHTMKDDEFDTLPYGAVLLNSDAVIMRYNKTEGDITGRNYKAVLGKKFFLELATCGVGPLFHGRFKQAMLASHYDEIFPYVFHYQMPETSMLVRMTLAPVMPKEFGNGVGVWVFVRRMMPQA